jgi:hypothetical protein
VTGEPHYVVIGGSHALRLSEAIQRSGAATITAAKPGRRVSNAVVENLAALVDEKVAEAGGGSKEDIYVFQLYDNSFHMARTEDCIYLPHSKDSCGNYHVFGEAVLAPRTPSSRFSGQVSRY